MACTRVIQKLASSPWRTYCRRTPSLGHHRHCGKQLLHSDTDVDFSILHRTVTSLHILTPHASCPGSTCINQVRFMAGHAHWQNIKHIKGAKDAEKSALIAKLVTQLKIVVKEEGSADPKQNKRLADLLYSMEKQNVPKATIQKSLQRLAKGGSDMQTHYMEVRGLLGSVFVVEVQSDNFKLVKDSFYSALKKTVGTLSDRATSWQHLFDQKGIITVPVTSDMDVTNLDRFLEIAIETGSEDVILTGENNDKDTERVLKFHCDPKMITTVAKEIEETYDLSVSSAEVELIPHMLVMIENEADIEACQKIVTKLQSIDAVINVFDNISVPED